MRKSWRVKLSLLTLIVSSSILNAATIQRDSLSDIEKTQRLLELRQKQDYINQQLMYPNKTKTKVETGILDEVKDGKKW